MSSRDVFCYFLVRYAEIRNSKIMDLPDFSISVEGSNSKTWIMSDSQANTCSLQKFKNVGFVEFENLPGVFSPSISMDFSYQSSSCSSGVLRPTFWGGGGRGYKTKILYFFLYHGSGIASLKFLRRVIWDTYKITRQNISR